jgi:hypothetical protein
MIGGLPYWLAIPIMLFGVITGWALIFWLLREFGFIQDNDRH